MKLVYVAGPYTHPDPVENAHEAIHFAEWLEDRGVAVVIPHLSLLWHAVSPAPVERWYERDLHVLERCDAVVRMDGSSRGADAECVHARSLGIPVFEWPADLGRFIYWKNDLDPPSEVYSVADADRR